MKLFTFLIGFIIISVGLKAQERDSLRGPHEGVVKEVGAYKIRRIWMLFITTDVTVI
jgi:hypothetical protein